MNKEKIKIYYDDKTKFKKIDFIDENDFKKKERSVRKYNMLAYKDLIFKYYPELKKGNYEGQKIESNEEDKVVKYELQLATDERFKKVYGPIILHYTVYTEKNLILLTDITPNEILIEGHRKELATYKGVPYANNKDLFKIKVMLGGK